MDSFPSPSGTGSLLGMAVQESRHHVQEHDLLQFLAISSPSVPENEVSRSMASLSSSRATQRDFGFGHATHPLFVMTHFADSITDSEFREFLQLQILCLHDQVFVAPGCLPCSSTTCTRAERPITVCLRLQHICSRMFLSPKISTNKAAKFFESCPPGWRQFVAICTLGTEVGRPCGHAKLKPRTKMRVRSCSTISSPMASKVQAPCAVSQAPPRSIHTCPHAQCLDYPCLSLISRT